MIEPLRLSFVVDCSADHAFHIWTARIDAWWPADHTVTGDTQTSITLQPRVGGRIFETSPDGTEHDWGEVTIWEPPKRLGYLWHLRRDRADATDVEIRFVEQADGSTLVDINHYSWERLGADGPQWRDRNRAGWQTLVPHYIQAVPVMRS
ncbi:MAG TPA: SRPBCC domain-containing protein [Candidatus Limnocylindrales bacterium]|nr:SRPBCC domain-containing protein [Candidatus Limnocylindrales bacterium]